MLGTSLVNFGSISRKARVNSWECLTRTLNILGKLRPCGSYYNYSRNPKLILKWFPMKFEKASRCDWRSKQGYQKSTRRKTHENPEKDQWLTFFSMIWPKLQSGFIFSKSIIIQSHMIILWHSHFTILLAFQFLDKSKLILKSYLNSLSNLIMMVLKISQ